MSGKDSVSVSDRFSSWVAWPIVGFVGTQIALALLFTIELSAHYFVNWYTWAIVFTVLGGVTWLTWTILQILDSFNCGSEEETESMVGKSTNHRNVKDRNLLWFGWVVATFYTVALVSFIWVRHSNVEISYQKDISTLDDFTAPEKETFYGIFELEATYIVGSGIYAAFGALLAFFAASGKRVDEINSESTGKNK